MLRFEKYHGIGNDFLVVEASSPDQISVQAAMKLCERHFGVGGDGVLLVSPPTTEGARATMTVLNADGSTPEMCGNGLRCVALHLARKANETTTSFLVDTGAGALRCDVERDGDRALIGTEIGQGTSRLPITHLHAGEKYEFKRITTGNPHAICFRDPISEELLDQIGPAVSASIEGGANVEIATVNHSTEIDVSVWERGVGRTLACGTGAAATVIAAVMEGHSPVETAVRVNLPGGPLDITVSPQHEAYLRGPAEWVYSGTSSHLPGSSD